MVLCQQRYFYLKKVCYKIVCFCSQKNKEELLNSLFSAGAGHIGNYSECSFSTDGSGTFKAGENSEPHVGKVGERHIEDEVKIEVIFPTWLNKRVIHALIKTHPYEEPAYDLYGMVNSYRHAGSGICGILKEGVDELNFLQTLKEIFKTPLIKHSKLRSKKLIKLRSVAERGLL